MKKIMIAYCTYGGGHLSAAKNIKDYMEEKYPDAQIFMFDFMKYINKVVDKVSGATYNNITKNTPWLWGKIYYHTQDQIFEKISAISNRVLSYKLNKIIKEFNPDIIISTHFFMGHMCSILKKKNKTTAKIATIITDYGEDPYNEWIAGHEYLDYIFVAHDDMKNKLIQKGVKDFKVFSTGIPISTNFLKNYDTSKIFDSINLCKDKKTILFFGGGELGLGKGKTVDIFKILSSRFNNIQIIAIAGKNEELKNTFEKIVQSTNRTKDIKVFGFTNRVAEFMRISSFVITKPGGLTTTECLVSNLPIIAINPIPGQETENATFLEETGSAIWIKEKSNIEYILSTIISNENILGRMKRNIQKIAKPNSTELICNILMKN